MKKTITKIIATALLAIPLGFALQANAADAPAWDVTGDYVVNFNLGGDYAHDMSLTQDGAGNLTGTGGYPAGGPQTFSWVLDSGTVSSSTIDFWAHYTADATASGTLMHVIGTVATTGAMSGTWTDNYQGGERSGTWATASGTAEMIATTTAATLNAEDFGVVNYDTGLGILKGYSAGFGLTDAMLASTTSVVVKLYSGATLLQTNTAIYPAFGALSGSQLSSPFDVSGTFDYATDGYWTNVREAQYGQSVPATRVVATVTLANGQVLVAENMVLAGDPTTIYPPVTPPTDTRPTTKDQCKNGGWKTFTNPSFKNQGQCVSSVANGK